MQFLFNRLYDIRKIAGGSGEMFWKGGFPGYVLKMDPNARSLTDAEKNTLEDTIASYSNGLQRYMRFQNIEVKSLEPQVADPKNHIDIQLTIIAIAMSVPKRILMGSEQAKLASSQDSENWNKRLKRRRDKYLTPYVIRPLIDRLITLGVLPEPTQYEVIWPDLNTVSDKDKAEVLRVLVEAFSKYIQGGVDQLIPPEVFLKMFADLTDEEIKTITEKARDRIDKFDEDVKKLEEEEDEDE
jgi:hypothetical protein